MAVALATTLGFAYHPLCNGKEDRFSWSTRLLVASALWPPVTPAPLGWCSHFICVSVHRYRHLTSGLSRRRSAVAPAQTTTDALAKASPKSFAEKA
jgi:hypothetical protein